MLGWADYRLIVESGQVRPGAAAIVGAIELRPEGVDAPRSSGGEGQSRAGLRHAVHRGRRRISRLGSALGRCPAFEINGFENSSRARPGIKFAAVRRIPDGTRHGPVAGDASPTSIAGLPTRRHSTGAVCAARMPAEPRQTIPLPKDSATAQLFLCDTQPSPILTYPEPACLSQRVESMEFVRYFHAARELLCIFGAAC